MVASPRIWTKPIQDEDVLLVEDIVDTGFTTRYLLQTLAGRGPRSLGICTLLDRTCAESCRCRSSLGVSKFRIGSLWDADSITGSCTATLAVSQS